MREYDGTKSRPVKNHRDVGSNLRRNERTFRIEKAQIKGKDVTRKG